MEVIVISLAFGALWAWVCNSMAAKRGRNTIGWTVAGFLVGLFAVVALAIAGKKAA